jgi:superoxide reductase
MTKINEVYKCDICGNIIEVLHTGAGQLVCCGAPMILKTENTVDASTEKHVPVIKETDRGIEVRVGSVDHPMESAHFIEWIELLVDDRVYRKYLKPGDAPVAVFSVSGEKIEAREYCNVHGLWKA